jgi:hypothetical protein
VVTVSILLEVILFLVKTRRMVTCFFRQILLSYYTW